jgi:hypothetical protein
MFPRLKHCLTKCAPVASLILDFDADQGIAKIYFVSATILSPDDRVSIYVLLRVMQPCAARRMTDAPKFKIVVRLNEPRDVRYRVFRPW